MTDKSILKQVAEAVELVVGPHMEYLKEGQAELKKEFVDSKETIHKRINIVDEKVNENSVNIEGNKSKIKSQDGNFGKNIKVALLIFGGIALVVNIISVVVVILIK